jgi:AcrR family transcriptional regulator
VSNREPLTKVERTRRIGANPRKKPRASAAQKPALAETDGRHARRLRTEARLFAALEDLLRKGGVAALGVNAVAERAEVEKVLIYRYFGGLEGLMAEYAKRSEFWPTLEEIIGPDPALLRDPDHARTAAKLLANYARALRKRPVTLNLLAWECAHRNPLTVALETVREERAQQVFQQLTAAGFPLRGPSAALSALLSGAINYLAMRGREIKVFAGLRLGDDAAWQEIEQVMMLAFRGVLEP